jgi:hypothetical protein
MAQVFRLLFVRARKEPAMTLERIVGLLFLGLLIIGGLLLSALGVAGTLYLIAGVPLLLGLIWWWPRRHWRALSQIAPPNLGFRGKNVHNLFFNHLLFIDERHGLAFGYTHQPYDARVYRTRDGGAHWQAEAILGSGKVLDVNLCPGGEIVLLQRFWEPDREDWCALQISEDEGLTWRVTGEIAGALGARFVDAARGFVWGGDGFYSEDPDEGDKFVKYTEDCGVNWEGIDIPPHVDLALRSSAHPDGSLFYIDGSNLVRLRRTAVRLWSADKHSLPLSIQDERLHIEGVAVWLVADQEKDAGQSVFRLNDSGEFERRGVFPARFYIDTISSYGPVITVVGGSSMAGDLPPAPRMTVFRSYDDGKTWRSEKPRMLRGSTVAFLGSHIWAIGGANRIQYRQ